MREVHKEHTENTAKAESIELFSVLRTGMDHERARYPDPELEGSYFSKERARDHMRALGDAEEEVLDSRFNARDVRADHWEAFQDGNSIACFSRIEIVSSRIALEELKRAGFAEVRQGLDILDELDKFRREHQDSKKHPSDWCMRVMEAIVARAHGFGDRMEWVEALKERQESQYSRDLQDAAKTGF